MKIEVCKGTVGLALYVDDERVAGPRHNGVMETVLAATVSAPTTHPDTSKGVTEAQIDAFAAEFYSVRTPVKWSESQRKDIRRGLEAALPAPGEGEAEQMADDIVNFVADWAAEDDEDTMRRDLEKLVRRHSTPSAGGLGTVKALTFEKQNLDGTFWASEVSVSGMYRVKFDGSRWRVLRNDVNIGDAGSSMAGINIAQAAHEARILSALDRTSLPPTEGMVPKIYGEEDEFVIHWPGEITISIAKDETGYAYKKNGKFVAGKYSIFDEPVLAAEEISAAISALSSGSGKP